MDYKIIAVDFDGTLCENRWPHIGKPNKPLIRYLIEQQNAGNKIILWTCRVGNELTEANWWCHSYGLYFDAINENLPEAIEMFGGDSRKIFAHEYIDDRMSTRFKLPYEEPSEIRKVMYDKALEDALNGPSIIEKILSKVKIKHDDLILEAFDKCGYSRDWLLDPDARSRVSCHISLEDNSEMWSVDGKKLFMITRYSELVHDESTYKYSVEDTFYIKYFVEEED